MPGRAVRVRSVLGHVPRLVHHPVERVHLLLPFELLSDQGANAGVVVVDPFDLGILTEFVCLRLLRFEGVFTSGALSKDRSIILGSNGTSVTSWKERNLAPEG